MNWVLNFKSMIGTEATWILIGIILVIAILAISLTLISKRRSRKSLEIFRKNMIDSVYKALRPDVTAEQTWNEWLIAISKITPGDNFFFYQCESVGGNLHLRAVRSSHQNISLANLVVSDAKQYRPPLMLSSMQAEEQVQAIAGGKKYTLLWLKDEKDILGMIQVGPPHGKWDPAMRAIATELVEAMARVQRIIVERLQMEKLTKEAINLSQAATLMRQSSTGSPQFLKQIMSLVLGSLHGDAVYLLKVIQPKHETSESNTINENARPLFIMSETKGLSVDDKSKITANIDKLPNDLGRLMTAAQLRQGQNLLEEPYYLLATSNCNSMISVPLWANNHFWGLLIVLANDSDRLSSKFLPAAIILAKRMAMSLENGNMYREMTISYIDTLKALVDYDDSLEPFTQGHSRQMASLSKELAEALKQEPVFVDAIYLAGYLHDVGMSGFLRQMATKQGSLTDQEMEQVRHHSARGATLVETINDSLSIAPFLKHHHERWDGMGYPEGLQGEQIPLGARILSVVDFFCAKITARSYRPPIPLKRALAEMEKAAETQLDPYLVKAFTDLWRKKVLRFNVAGNLEGCCWNMQQCPDFLTYACPAYQQPQKNCWEIPGVLCLQHGDNCESCHVYTAHQFSEETITRPVNRYEA